MRKLLFISLLLIQTVFAINVKTIKDIEKYKLSADQIFVMDVREAGVFYRYTGTMKADGGVVIKDGLGRLWMREWDQANGVNPAWWGAKGDGVTDDIVAYEKAVKFCKVDMMYGALIEWTWLPLINTSIGGVYAFSRPLIIGGAPCSPADAMKLNWFNRGLPSYNWPGHQLIAGQLPISMKFNQRAYIKALFRPDTLTAVISYGSDGWSYGGWDMQNAVIEGLKVCGPDGMDMYKHGRGSNLVGLVMYGGRNTTMSGCGFYNLEVGMIQNSTYFDNLHAMQFRNCGIGYLSQGSHSTNGYGWHASYCDVAFEIRSGASVFTGMNTEECKTALIVGNGFNHFNGLYFEKSNTEPNDTTNYQLIIGYDKGVDPRGDNIIRRTTITAMSISGGINGILMKELAEQLDISGSVFVSTKVKTTSPDNRMIIRNCYGEAYQPQIGRIDYVY